MKKNVLITGATGMVGSLVLEQCLQSEEVAKVTSLSRSPTGKQDTKLLEVLVEDFDHLDSDAAWLNDVDVVYYCMGAYTTEVDKETFKKVTVDYPAKLADLLIETSPDLIWCLLSGNGADRRERSPFAFAKYKGMIENRLANMGFKSFHSFRPAYIYPVEKRTEPNMTYVASRMAYPLIAKLGKHLSIKSTELASGIFNVGLYGTKREVLENAAILKVA